jgi:hypothetical protein
VKDDEQRHIVAYLDGLQAKLIALRELQAASGEELRPLFGRTLMPSILDKAFKGEL